MTAVQAVLDRVTAVRGIRGAALVSATDGLVVAEAVMDGVDGRAVAALVGSMTGKLRRAVECAQRRAPRFLQLQAERGAVLAAPCGTELLLVAIAAPDANVGLARLEMLEAAGRLA